MRKQKLFNLPDCAEYWLAYNTKYMFNGSRKGEVKTGSHNFVHRIVLKFFIINNYLHLIKREIMKMSYR